jgi:hypothetical protein
MVVGDRSRFRVVGGNLVRGRIGRRRYEIVGRVLMTRGENSGYLSESYR